LDELQVSITNAIQEITEQREVDHQFEGRVINDGGYVDG
jgi:hypothetical protein